MEESKKLLADTFDLARSIKENTDDKVRIKGALLNILQLLEHNMYRETGYHDRMQTVREEYDYDLRGELAPKTSRVSGLSSRVSTILNSFPHDM